MAEVDRTNPNCLRVREAKATASYYYESRRITLVADNGHFLDAQAALKALRDEMC